MAQFGSDIEEDLRHLDAKIKQCKNEYEQYFLGSRPREPSITRSEVQKMIALYAQSPIPNTGHRFKFNNLRSRYFAFRRHWDETLRKIEQGTYERHVFKAKLHENARNEAPAAPRTTRAGDRSNELFEAYVSARQACGQEVASVDRKQLATLLATQEKAIRQKYGCDVAFKVVVEQGKAKLKAVRAKG